MTRIALGISYDGAGWHGWQSQPHRRTVQDALEDALSRFSDRTVRVACAGRTDTGVHALGQVVHFDCDARRTLQGWVRGVNALLPPSIVVTWSVAFPDADDGGGAPATALERADDASGPAVTAIARIDDGSSHAQASATPPGASLGDPSVPGSATRRSGDGDADRRFAGRRVDTAVEASAARPRGRATAVAGAAPAPRSATTPRCEAAPCSGAASGAAGTAGAAGIAGVATTPGPATTSGIATTSGTATNSATSATSGAAVAAGATRTAAPAERRSPFDARFDAMARTYHYLLLVQPQRSPHWIGRAGWTHTPLDLDAMRRACASLVGTHDFSAFRSAECQARSPIKTVSLATVDASGPFVRFTFRANAFLHHMVRNLVGTLVAIGRGREAPEWIASLIAGRDRTAAAPTFMPDGLYLARVDYPDAIPLPAPVPFAHVHAGFAEAFR